MWTELVVAGGDGGVPVAAEGSAMGSENRTLMLEYSRWTGPNDWLLKEFRAAKNGEYEPDVCARNLRRLLPMTEREVRMMGMLVADLKQASFGHWKEVLEGDVEWAEGLLGDWRKLLARDEGTT